MIYAHVGSQFGQELPISDVLSKFRFTDSRPESRFGRDRSDESMQYSGSIGTTFVPSESTPDNLASEILEMVASDAKSRPEIESHMELPSQTDIAFTNGRASTALKSGEGYVVDGIVVRATDLFSFNGILADETENNVAAVGASNIVSNNAQAKRISMDTAETKNILSGIFMAREIQLSPISIPPARTDDAVLNAMAHSCLKCNLEFRTPGLKRYANDTLHNTDT
jgi:hypothetical protein